MTQNFNTVLIDPEIYTRIQADIYTLTGSKLLKLDQLPSITLAILQVAYNAGCFKGTVWDKTSLAPFETLDVENKVTRFDMLSNRVHTLESRVTALERKGNDHGL